jgi:hypothetical protein
MRIVTAAQLASEGTDHPLFYISLVLLVSGVASIGLSGGTNWGRISLGVVLLAAAAGSVYLIGKHYAP